MVIIHNNKTEIVNNLQDCLNLADKDNNRELVEATESLAIEKYEEDDMSYTKEELESENKDLEFDVESRESCLREVMEVTEELKNKVEKFKRLDNDVIIDYLKSIIDTIDCEI